MTFYVRDLNDFMTVQNLLFLLLLMIQDFRVVRVRFIQSVSALRLSLRLSSTFSSFLDVHRAVALTGQPNYRIARLPVFSTLNIAMWRELL